MNRFRTVSVAALSCVLGLAGCGDEPKPKAPVVAGSAASADPRYEATLGEGIDFSKPGYPNFLSQVSGMSVYEPWGRWTDAAAGPAATFRFKQSLPKKFTLEITAKAFGPNIGQPVKVRVGSIEKTFVITDKKDADTYRLAFETDGAADALEITPPKPTSPVELGQKTGDTRKLGVAFISIKLRD